MTSDQVKVWTLHIVSAIVIGGLVWLSMLPALKDNTQVIGVLLGAAIFLYGKAGFTPIAPVLARVIQNMEPTKVAAIVSQRPPALPITPAGAVVLSAVPPIRIPDPAPPTESKQ
jgi:hypothetical protein